MMPAPLYYFQFLIVVDGLISGLGYKIHASSVHLLLIQCIFSLKRDYCELLQMEMADNHLILAISPGSLLFVSALIDQQII